MLSKIAQKLNKSFTGPKSNSPNNSPPREPCSICKGLGCCNVCDRDDYWDDLIYCSNKKENHVLHYACDNLSPDTVKFIKQYYCPKCRLDGNFEVTFYKKTSLAKQNEISKVLKLEKTIEVLKNKSKKSEIPKENSYENLERSSVILIDPENNGDSSLLEVTEIMESILKKVIDTQNVSSTPKVSIPPDNVAAQVSTPLTKIGINYQSDNDSSSDSELSDDDSFGRLFPGQESNTNNK